jgi:hypothetical protein
MTHTGKRASDLMPQAVPDQGQKRTGILLSKGNQQNAGFKMAALRHNTKQSSLSANRFFAAIIFGLFALVLLLAFLVGINVYQSLNVQSVNESNARMGQAFLANTIHSNDLYDAVSAGVGPEGESLVLSETVDNSGTYETRIYKWQGSLMQEYALAGSEYAPEKAIQLFETETFSFVYSGGLLNIETDQGTLEVALRCAEEMQS